MGSRDWALVSGFAGLFLPNVGYFHREWEGKERCQSSIAKQPSQLYKS